MPELDILRAELAEIDKKIMGLVGRRNEIAKVIGEEKAKTAAPVVVPSVERIVEQRYIDAGAKTGVTANTAFRIARAVVDESVDVQGRLPRFQEPQSICIIGGNGGMGRWLSNFFAARGHHVSICDPNTDDAEFPVVSFEDGAKSDIIVISTPVTIADKVLADVLEASSDDAVIFDILSVKQPVIPRLRKAGRAGRKVCSVHPMFGPSAASAAGRNVIICDCGSKDAADKAAVLFNVADILRMEVEEHDKAAAYVLGLSHAVNIAFSDALVRSGFTSEALRACASTTFRKQTAVSVEVANENAELYYAIQRENPENDAALRNLEEAVSRVRTLSKDEFISMMQDEAVWYQ